MATSAELYQLSWVIEQLLADPRRIVQVRAQLHTGQQVQYLHWADGKLRPARVVGIHGDHVAVLDAAFNKAFKVHYAAIITDEGSVQVEGLPGALLVQTISGEIRVALPGGSGADMKRLPTPLIARIRVAAEERRVRI